MKTRQLNPRWRWAVLELLGLVVGSAAQVGVFAGPRSSPVQAQSKAEYVDSSICAGCHAGIAATYRQTGRGQSFHRATAADRTQSFTTPNTLYNAASDRYYTMLERDRRLY